MDRRNREPADYDEAVTLELAPYQATQFTFRSPLRLEDCAEALRALAFPAHPDDPTLSQSVDVTPTDYDTVSFRMKRYYKRRFHQQCTAIATGTLTDRGDDTTLVLLTLNWPNLWESRPDVVVRMVFGLLAFFADVFLFGGQFVFFLIFVIVMNVTVSIWVQYTRQNVPTYERQIVLDEIEAATNPDKFRIGEADR